MCEKRTKKIKKGSHMTRLREARRLQRIQMRVVTPPPIEVSLPTPGPQHVLNNKRAQNRVILELAWKTVALMHKNRLIQQKIVALQKETSEFVKAIMNNPENKRRYLEYIRVHGLTDQLLPKTADETKNIALKIEPE